MLALALARVQKQSLANFGAHITILSLRRPAGGHITSESTKGPAPLEAYTMSSFSLFHRHILHALDRRAQPLHPPPPPQWSGGSSPQTSCLPALKLTAIRGAYSGDIVPGGFNPFWLGHDFRESCLREGYRCF
jgi:hypothetical protein